MSSFYASVKAGEIPRAPYVKPHVETAVCKRCGMKVSREVDAIECHEQRCGTRRAVLEDQGTEGEEKAAAAAAEEEEQVLPLEKSFSATSLELAETELKERLSSESRHLFRETQGASWQRYSVSFGPGRMGLEFEYDGRGTRRLMVTRASREAAQLGVRERDVLIGVGNRTVPRAIDPMAVHRHLLTCERPVTLHFYRLHVRRKENASQQQQQAPPQREAEQEQQQPRLVSTVAHAVWDRLPAVFSSVSTSSQVEEEGEKEEEKAAVVEEEEAYVLPPPNVIADPKWYRDDDDEEEEPFEACVASPPERAALAAELKPMLRMRSWKLLYDSSVDGMLLERLYAFAHARSTQSKDAPQLLLVRDNKKNVAGAFVDERIRNAGDYFGTGECFVFAFPERALGQAKKIDGQDIQAGAENDEGTSKVDVYRWVGPGATNHDEHHQDDSHPPLDHPHIPQEFEPPEPPPLPSIENDMFIYAKDEVLGFGSGGGGFAIRLDGALEHGASRPCATYGTPHSLFDGQDTFRIDRVQLFEFARQWSDS